MALATSATRPLAAAELRSACTAPPAPPAPSSDPRSPALRCRECTANIADTVGRQSVVALQVIEAGTRERKAGWPDGVRLLQSPPPGPRSKMVVSAAQEAVENDPPPTMRDTRQN